MPAARFLFTTWPKKSLSSCYILPQYIFRVFKIILKEMVKMITKFKFIRKKSEILNAGHGLMQYYSLLSPCSHSVEQAKERKFTIFTQTIMQLVYRPKFCITIILNISLGTTVIPGRNWKQWFCRVLGATKVDYGLNMKMVNTVLLFISSKVFQYKI